MKTHKKSLRLVLLGSIFLTGAQTAAKVHSTGSGVQLAWSLKGAWNHMTHTITNIPHDVHVDEGETKDKGERGVCSPGNHWSSDGCTSDTDDYTP